MYPEEQYHCVYHKSHRDSPAIKSASPWRPNGDQSLSQGTVPALEPSALVTTTDATVIQNMLTFIKSKEAKKILMKMREDQETHMVLKWNNNTSFLGRPNSQLGFSTLDDGTDRLSGNVGKELPLKAA